MVNYPKIVLLSGYEILDAHDATSITIRSLLRDWPQDRLCEIYCGMYESEEQGVIQRDSKLNLSVKDVWFGEYLSKLRAQKNKVVTENTISEIVSVKKQSFKDGFKQKLKFFFNASADLFSYKTAKLDAFISEQEPDLIYVIPYGKRILDLTLSLHKTHGIPVITHLMDDWPTTIYSASYSTLLQRKLTLAKFDKLLAVSQSVFVISEAMKREYETRHPDVKFTVFMNTPRIGLTKSSIPSAIDKVICIGSLHLNRWQTLVEFCKTIAHTQQNLTIHIYSNDWDKVKHHFAGFNFIHSKEVIAPEKIPNELQQYDALLFLESFDPGVKTYTKYSVSTKIPEYLGAQKPIIAIGPSDIASISYLKENDAAIVLDETNQEHWNDILLISLSDKSKIQAILDHAKNLFTRKHDADLINDDFYKAVNDVV